MNYHPISRETGGLSDSRRLKTKDDSTTTIAEENEDDGVDLQESSSFLLIGFSTRPMTNNNNKLNFGSTKSLLQRKFQL